MRFEKCPRPKMCHLDVSFGGGVGPFFGAYYPSLVKEEQSLLFASPGENSQAKEKEERIAVRSTKAEISGKCSRREDNHRLLYARLPVLSSDRPVVRRGVSKPTLSIYPDPPVEVT